MNYDVLICTYNGSHYIEEQIKSILFQTVKPHKIIISDDGSSDSTLIIVDRIMNAYSFDNYVIIKGPQKGVALNFFYGFKYSVSDYLFLSDQDDIWIREKAAILLSEAIKYENNLPLLLFSDSILIDEVGSIFHHSFFCYQKLDAIVLNDDSIFYKNCVQGATVVINREMLNLAISSLKSININNIVMHDWWLALLAKYYGQYCFVDQGLILYRQHRFNQVGAKSGYHKYVNYFLNFNKYLQMVKKIILQKNELMNFNLSMLDADSSSHKKYNNNLSCSNTYKHVGFFKRMVIYFLDC